MNVEKRNQLVQLAKRRGYTDMGSPRVLVTPTEFFDGNDDEGSIGCNLSEHPGIAAFADAFRAIESMDGVAGVFLAVTEIDDTYEDMWPFVDTAYISTRLPQDAFSAVLSPLQPDTIERHSEPFANPPEIPDGYRLLQVWWD